MNYNIIITWSIVDICDLYKRNKSRSIETAKLFIETFADSAPRLPDIRKKNYKRTLINIMNTYNELVKYHGNRSLSKLRLLLFDNRTKTSKILYDSYINSDKIGYREILKYNIHSNCDNETSKKSLTTKSVLSPTSRKSLSPTSRKSLSPKSRKSLSPKYSFNSSTQLLSPTSSNNIEILPSTTRSKSIHPMKTRSKGHFRNFSRRK